MSVEKVMVIRVTKGQIWKTAKMPCFSDHFGDFKTNPNGHEILQIIYRWKGMDVYFLLFLWNEVLMSVEKVMVIRVIKGHIWKTTEMPCFSGQFRDIKTNPNSHEILRIIYR